MMRIDKEVFTNLFKCKQDAFSVVELLISLIAISSISAAFAPVVSKKISTNAPGKSDAQDNILKQKNSVHGKHLFLFDKSESITSEKNASNVLLSKYSTHTFTVPAGVNVVNALIFSGGGSGGLPSAGVDEAVSLGSVTTSKTFNLTANTSYKNITISNLKPGTGGEGSSYIVAKKQNETPKSQSDCLNDNLDWGYNTCVSKSNVGSSEIPIASGVTKVALGQTCSSNNCCWYSGETAFCTPKAIQASCSAWQASNHLTKANGYNTASGYGSGSGVFNTSSSSNTSCVGAYQNKCWFSIFDNSIVSSSEGASWWTGNEWVCTSTNYWDVWHSNTCSKNESGSTWAGTNDWVCTSWNNWEDYVEDFCTGDCLSYAQECTLEFHYLCQSTYTSCGDSPGCWDWTGMDGVDCSDWIDTSWVCGGSVFGTSNWNCYCIQDKTRCTYWNEWECGEWVPHSECNNGYWDPQYTGNTWKNTWDCGWWGTNEGSSCNGGYHDPQYDSNSFTNYFANQFNSSKRFQNGVYLGQSTGATAYTNFRQRGAMVGKCMYQKVTYNLFNLGGTGANASIINNLIIPQDIVDNFTLSGLSGTIECTVGSAGSGASGTGANTVAGSNGGDSIVLMKNQTGAILWGFKAYGTNGGSGATSSSVGAGGAAKTKPYALWDVATGAWVDKSANEILSLFPEISLIAETSGVAGLASSGSPQAGVAGSMSLNYVQEKAGTYGRGAQGGGSGAGMTVYAMPVVQGENYTIRVGAGGHPVNLTTAIYPNGGQSAIINTTKGINITCTGGTGGADSPYASSLVTKNGAGGTCSATGSNLVTSTIASQSGQASSIAIAGNGAINSGMVQNAQIPCGGMKAACNNYSADGMSYPTVINSNILSMQTFGVASSGGGGGGWKFTTSEVGAGAPGQNGYVYIWY